MEELELEIKDLLVNELQLDDLEPGELEADTPLFGDGLGLDSIDALELGAALGKRYNIQFEGKDPAVREAFANIRSLASYVAQERAKE